MELTKVCKILVIVFWLYIISQVHILGASLGAFLAQKVAEKTFRSPRIVSIFICNGFTDTTAFKQTVTAKTWVISISLSSYLSIILSIAPSIYLSIHPIITCIYLSLYRFWVMPAFMLKRQILINLPSENLEGNVANSIDFMVERVS